ncbi:gamma-glutamyltransferase family protein [soil metagenome]
MTVEADGSGSERPASWRTVGAEAIMAEQCQARGQWGLVAAAAPTAALIGADILRSGGNAYDAAVAAALAETVLLPPKCGLGGDLIAMVWPAGSEVPETLIAVGGAPAGLAAIAAAGHLTETGPMSVGVPAAPAGYAALAERGVFSLERLVEPAIVLAERGFAWSRICAVLSDESRVLVRQHSVDNTRYYPDGRALTPGETVRLPGMARMLEKFAASGADIFQGAIGQAIVSRVRGAGGVLDERDFEFARAEWGRPVSLSRAEALLYATPAPTHGASLLDAVSQFPTDGDQSDAYRAALAAIATRRDTLGDPSGTSMVTVMDSVGTMVLIVHSNSFPRFGSGLILSEYDMILANRAGRGFNAVEGHPNFPLPGKRPASTLHAWAARLRDGRRMLGATPGGTNQMPWNASTIASLLAGETDVGKLVVAPRWEWRPQDDGVVLEDGFSLAEAQRLSSVAPSTVSVDRWAMRSAMQIVTRDGRGNGAIAVDPRTVGAVVAL